MPVFFVLDVVRYTNYLYFACISLLCDWKDGEEFTFQMRKSEKSAKAKVIQIGQRM